MKTNLYWINGSWPGRLAISSRPRGGDWLEDEVRAWRLAGLDMIVSLLTQDEVVALNLEQEAQLCRKHGMQFLTFPIIDRSVPASRHTALDFVRELESALSAEKSLLIHCRQGIGRSALVAACLLISSGMEAESAFQKISAVRGVAVPETPEQRRWVMDVECNVVPQTGRRS